MQSDTKLDLTNIAEHLRGLARYELFEPEDESARHLVDAVAEVLEVVVK